MKVIHSTTFSTGVLIGCLLTVSGATASHQTAGAPKSSSLQLIEEAYKRGDIDYGTALVNKAHALLSPTKLDDRFKTTSSFPAKCATPVFLEIKENWPTLSSKTRDTLHPYLLRPSEDDEDGDYAFRTEPASHVSPAGHFKIWYVTSTSDAPSLTDVNPPDGVPDYVNQCAAVFDHCWNQEVNTLGYLAPPADGPWYPFGEDYGGDSRYDVYVVDLGGSLYGYTAPEYKAADLYTNAMTSYIVVDNDYDGFGYPDPTDPLMVTAAHEFFHAVQFAYDTFEDTYFMEISSTWMEDVIYDTVNDYLFYLDAFFQSPQVSLTNTDGLHEYASCIWAHYITERFGLDVMNQFWEECGIDPTKNSLNAFGTVLSRHGTSREDAFNEFTVWNYFTGDRADSSHYSEGALWPQVTLHTGQIHSTYPVSVTNPPRPPERWGSNYIQFNTNALSTGLRITFDGSYEVDWGTVCTAYRDTEEHPIVKMNLSNNGGGSIEVPEWHTYSKIVLIPSVTSAPKSYTRQYVYFYWAEQMDISNAAVPEVRAGSDKGGETGQEIPVSFTVTNTSLFPSDTFATLLSDTQGWPLTSSPSVSLEPGEESVVIVSVSIPDGIPAGTADTLTLTAISMKDSSSTDSDDLTVTVLQPLAGNPKVTAGDDTTGTPGSFLPLFFGVSNKEYTRSDSFAVTLEDEFGWVFVPDSLEVSLSPGADTRVETGVTIPDSVTPETQNIISCTATSLSDSSKWSSDSVTITVEAPRAALSAGNGFGLPGSSRNTVELFLDNNAEIGRILFSLFEDSDLIAATNTFPVGRAAALSFTFADSAGHLTFELSDLSGQGIAPGSGPVLQIEYAVVASAEAGQLIPIHPSHGVAETPEGISVPLELAGSTFSVCRRPGDVNGDEKVDVFDIVQLVDIILDIGEPTPLERCAADCHPDGSTNILDAICILGMIQ